MVVSCLGPKKDVSIVIHLGKAMICWSTDEGWDTRVVLAVDGRWVSVVLERMLVSLLSVSVDPCEMSWAGAALALDQLY